MAKTENYSQVRGVFEEKLFPENHEGPDSYYAPNAGDLEKNHEDPAFQDVLDMLKLNSEVEVEVEIKVNAGRQFSTFGP
jgi:hypothetical protein